MAAPRLTYVVTHAVSAQHLLRGQLAYMRERGFDVTLVCNPDPKLADVAEREGIAVRPVKMTREIDAAADAESLGRLIRVLGELRPDVVNAGTPKAGLLGILAARVVQVPARVYMLRGLRLETSRGPERLLLGAAERTAAACATRVLAVSHSLRQVYIRGGFAPSHKVTVVANGSSNGVDVDRFAAVAGVQREAWRRRLGIPTRAPVIGFVGRFTSDKGVETLVEAFERVGAEYGNAHLLLVGDYEPGDPVPDAVKTRIAGHPRIVTPGLVAEVMPYYAIMDVLALPSRREGFPNVALEAAACGVPTVGARATGTVDAVRDGVTGTLVPVGDAQALARALVRYLQEPSLRRRHGESALARVDKGFRPERIWGALHDEYRRLLA